MGDFGEWGGRIWVGSVDLGVVADYFYGESSWGGGYLALTWSPAWGCTSDSPY